MFECSACPLGPGPHVAADGPPDASIVLVGEAPGYNEARTGKPFVGQSGKLLDKLIGLAGWERADLRVTNLVMCRPPDNRKPTADERKACRERLLDDIKGAKVVVLLGALAIDEFLPGTKLKVYHGLPKLRDGVVFVPMYHPAAALYAPELRATLMADWQNLPSRLVQEHPRIETDYGIGFVDTQEYDLVLALDSEVNIGDGRVVCFSISDRPGFARVIASPAEHDGFAVGPSLVLMHNAKFDLKQLVKCGYTVDSLPIADTMLAAYLVGEPQLGLKPLALKRLGVEMQTLGPLMGQATGVMVDEYLVEAESKLEPPSGKRKLWRLGGSAALAKSFREVQAADDKAMALSRRHALREAIGQPPKADVEDVARLLPNEFINYACADADMTRRIWPGLLAEMKDKGVEDLFWNVEMPLVRVLVDMEAKGLAVDRDEAAKLRDELRVKATALGFQLKSQVGLENPLSPDAVGVALYDTLKLPVLGYTESGKPTTARWAMEILGEKEPIVHDILEYRKYRKLVGTYLDPWIASTGRIHADFNQVRQASDEEAWGATATGRLSSSGPNFQNIPARDELGRRVRSCIIAEPGNVLLSLDDKQIELLLMAIDANDEEWLELFAKGEDLHMATARHVFGPNPTGDQRKAAKNINFAWGYGVRAGRLAKMLALSGVPHSRDDAQRYIDKFEAAHPRLRSRWHEVVDEARTKGYATTMWERRRYLPQLQVAQTDEEFYEAAKQAYNHRIQGTAADLSKVAAKVVADLCPNQLVALIHDERLLEVPQAVLTRRWVDDIIVSVLEKTRPLIPHGDLMRIEAKAGTRWGDLKEVS